jgi:DNA repair protein RAD16
VATPIQRYGNSDGGQRAMILLTHKILKNIVLRRTKADLPLPPRIVSFYCCMAKFPPSLSIFFSFAPFNSSIIFVQVSLRWDALDIKEQDYYESIYNESQAQFNTYVNLNLFCIVFQFWNSTNLCICYHEHHFILI